MIPKGTFILLGIGAVLLGSGFGLAFLVGEFAQPAHLLIRLLIMAMVGIGVIVLWITVYGVIISVRDRNRQ